MNDRRKSARLSLKTSPCSGSSLSKQTFLECSPPSSSALNTFSKSSSPQTSSPFKLNKSNSKLSRLPSKQQIKNAVKRSPRVITSLLNTEKQITKEKKITTRSKKPKTSYTKSRKSSSSASSKTNKAKSQNSRKKSKRSSAKQSTPTNTITRILRSPSVDSPSSPTDSPIAVSSLLTINSSTPTTSSSLNNLILNTPNNRQTNGLINTSQNTTIAENTNFISNVETLLRNNLPLNIDNTVISTSNPLSDINIHDLKFQLKKATVKFEKACRQLIMLDQHINDLQNSYSNSLENDRKTFKIVYRMQLATLEGDRKSVV